MCLLIEIEKPRPQRLASGHICNDQLLTSKKVSSIQLELTSKVARNEWWLTSVDWFKFLDVRITIHTYHMWNILCFEMACKWHLQRETVQETPYKRLICHRKPLNGWPFQIPCWKLCKAWSVTLTKRHFLFKLQQTPNFDVLCKRCKAKYKWLWKMHIILKLIRWKMF